MITLRQFANNAGVKIIKSEPGWGGRWSYTTADYPDCVISGFKTVDEARKEWATSTFGEQAAKALFSLLGKPQR